MRYILWFGLSAVLAAIQGVACAQGLGSSGAVVRGNTEINANAQNVNTIAVGSGNTAKTNIGTVRGNVRESTKVTVDVKNVTNVVGGHGRKGCINIGTKGTDPDCQ